MKYLDQFFFVFAFIVPAQKSMKILHVTKVSFHNITKDHAIYTKFDLLSTLWA